MGYIQLYPSDREQPDEFESDNPVECARPGCGQVWDLDDDDDGKFVEIDDKYYCAEGCADSVAEDSAEAEDGKEDEDEDEE